MTRSLADRGVFGRLLFLALPEWRRLTFGVALVAVAGAAGLCYPQAIRLLVDGALGAPESSVLGIAGYRLTAALPIALLALAVLQGGSVAVRYALFESAGERIVSALRLRVYGAILDQEIGFFDRRPTGELLSRLSTDAELLKGVVSVNVSVLLSQTVGVLGGFAMLLYTSPSLTLVMLAVVPPVALGAVLIGRHIEVLSRDAQDALATSGAVAEEGIAGIRTVRAFGAESRELARYGAALDRAFGSALRRVRASALLTFGIVSSIYASVGVVFWYGAGLVQRGGISMGTLASFLIYTLLVAVSLASLAAVFGELSRARGAAERIFELEDRVPAIPTSGGLTPTDLEGRVAFCGVHFSYPTRPDALVLGGLDLEIAPGQAVAIVGASGAGKTTLALLLARFYEPAQGSIRLDGRDLRDLDPGWLRRQIGVVAQEPILFSGSIAENIGYAKPGATGAEIEAAARAANAHDFIARLPETYDTQVGERGLRLSGGQKQRVAIARAILKDPRFLILDEATSALDAESEHLVQEALARLMRGRTSIVIAHRLSTVAHADRVVVMEAGQIVQAGSHEALMKLGGLYRRLVERQFLAA